MSDTIDWSKPLQVEYGGKWKDVDAVAMVPGGDLYRLPFREAGFAVVGGRLDYYSTSQFRNKPETREPLECWAVDYAGRTSPLTGYTVREAAESRAEKIDGARVIRMVEVQDDE